MKGSLGCWLMGIWLGYVISGGYRMDCGGVGLVIDCLQIAETSIFIKTLIRIQTQYTPEMS